MAYGSIQFYPGPRVSSIVLNRPPLNIIDAAMLKELNQAWTEVEELGSQVAVFTGAGDRAFSVGVDVADHASDRVGATLKAFHRLVRRICDSKCIVIAAIHGHTLGGGAELAMICDLIIAADDASIGQPEISLGCYPPVATAYLPRAIGVQKAAEMILLGEPISAVEAQRVGLINKIASYDQLAATVDDVVDRLLMKSGAVLALTKRALREGWDHRFEKALERTEALYLKKVTSLEDMTEGMQAFLEKRSPNWKNR
jgi:cyclohexa-1,5-dienecarbonyl-CoA hydratase